MGDCRIVDEDVDATKVRFDLCYHALHIGDHRHIGPYRDGLSSHPGDFGTDCMRSVGTLTVGNGDIAAGPSQCDCDCGSDSSTAASHKGHSIRQVIHSIIVCGVTAPNHPWHAGRRTITGNFEIASLFRKPCYDRIKPPGFHLIPEINPLASEAIFDKIAMSTFEGTPLDIALRDCGINAFAIVGIAMEIGVEPTVRHGADLGYIPVVAKDVCGFGHRDAAERSIASLEFAGDVLITNVETICAQLGRIVAQTTS